MTGQRASTAAGRPYPPVDGTQPCADMDPELFFPTSSDNHATIPLALAACERCPVRRECLAHALTHDLQGIWGGTSEPQRKALRREHGITAAPVALSPDRLEAQIDRLDDGTRSARDISIEVGCTTRSVVRRRTARKATA